MDSKVKKRLEVLQKRLSKLRLQLAGAVKQNDDPQELVRLRREVEDAEAELQRLKEA
jgi:hypothetical protein